MERHSFGNSDLTVSAIGVGCYGMSGVYDPADDAESIATIRRALDLGVNFSRHIGQLRQRPQSPLDRRSNPRPRT
jgi:predicted aldo/keto reductase-like oxidoreductase